MRPGCTADSSICRAFCTFPSVADVPADAQLIPSHVITYVLSTSATVAEAREALAKVTVYDWSGSPVPLTVHFRFDDASGGSIVVEWIDGEMRIHDNPIGVMTNSPDLPWHLTNLRNHVNLQTPNPKAKTINGVELAPLGVGEGMHGLPGDATPPDRFVRAVAYVATVDAGADAASAEHIMFHLVNNFDLAAGFAAPTTSNGCDQTLWTTISTLSERRFSVRMATDHTFRMLDLATMVFTGSAVASHPLPAPERFPAWNLA
jgi:choloylglycine hydrolase